VKMSTLRFGMFMLSTSACAIIVSTVLAKWSDTHWSRRSMLLLGSGCGALGYLGFAWVRDPVWLTMIGCTVLALSSVTFSQLFAHARELLTVSKVPAEQIPLYNNVFRLFFALAWTIGPAVAAWVMVLYSYRGMFAVAASIFVVLFLVIAVSVPSAPPPAARAAASHIPLRTTLTRPDLFAYFIGFILINAGSTMAMMDLPLLVLSNLGGTPCDIGIIYGVGPIFELPLMLYFGVLASHGDQTRVIRLGALIAVVYYSLLLMVRAPWHVYPLQILSAAMVAVNSGVAITFFQNYLPGQPGTATNLFITAARVGSTAGYFLFGSLAAAIGYRAVFSVCSLFSLITLLLFIHQDRQARSLMGAANSAAHRTG
ncbi:MAG: sugar efflux transporter, partial [Opitutus sp.]